jgi:hypothetical protein
MSNNERVPFHELCNDFRDSFNKLNEINEEKFKALLHWTTHNDRRSYREFMTLDENFEKQWMKFCSIKEFFFQQSHEFYKEQSLLRKYPHCQYFDINRANSSEEEPEPDFEKWEQFLPEK